MTPNLAYHQVHVNLARSIRHHAIRHPDRLAVVADSFRQTFSELDQRSDRLALSLQNEFGVRPGVRVAYLMGNRPQIPELLAAIWKLGAIAVPLNFRLSGAEIQAIAANASPFLLVTDSEYLEVARTALHTAGIPVLDIDNSGFEGLLDRASGDVFRLPVADAQDDACIVYTSGTTGPPKGAVFTHAAVMNHAANLALECGLGGDSRYLVSLPHHVSVTVAFASCFYVGATVVTTEVRAFDGERFVDDVNRHGVTHTEIVPTQLYRVLEAARDRHLRIPSMRTICYGSAPAAPDRVREMIDRFGPIFMQVYGMTETCGIATTLRKEEHVRALAEAPGQLSSAGHPSYGMHIRVVDDRGVDVAVGERGEVWFRSPYIMRGYWQNPEQTAEAIVDGHVRSGDIGEIRNDGCLYLVDRKKDLIIRGGQNLGSKEIEEVLFQHPGVLEVAVVAAPDHEWGEEAVAVVVRRAGSGVSAAELAAFCADQGLSRFKTPNRFDFVESLPKNSSGKIAKSELRDRYRQAPTGTHSQ